MAWERKANRRRLGIAGLAFLGLIALLYWTHIFPFNLPIFLLSVFGMIAVDRGFIPRMDHFKRREDQATRGAEAEETVGAILDRLPNLIMQHDLQGPSGNIDHLVVRNDGAVFLIETKSHRGRITEQNGQLLLNGKLTEKDFIAQVQRNVAWAREHLRARFGVTPWIQAALVFTNAYVPSHCKLREVDVINVSYLERWMAKASGQPEMRCGRQKG